jgi:hypothetical protein
VEGNKMQQTSKISSEVFIQTESGKTPLKICYYLRNCEYHNEEGSYNAFAVGAKLFSGEELLDECKAEDVVLTQEEAFSMIGLLSRNSVTPCSLTDVIDDYLACS